MRKTNILRMTGIIAFIAIIGFSIVECASFLPHHRPAREFAEDPPGLSVDPANCAYIGGKIRAIDDFDFDMGKGALYSYSGRTVRVPAGETMVALVHYNYQVDSTVYYGFSHISLPPLENGGLYVLFFNPYDSIGGTAGLRNRSLSNKHITFRKLNKDTRKYEDIKGANIIQPTLNLPF
jgi:hypothetical protein